MAIEDILKALEEQAQADIDAVLDEARAHADLIEKQAIAEAEGIRDGYAKQVERSANSRASKLVNAARLESKMAVSSARGDGLEAVFAGARERLGGLRSEASYPNLFAKLAEEALAGIEGDVVIHVDPADAELAQAALAKHGAGRVETDLKCAGGVVVESSGGRIVRRNTLEDRLERSRQLVQAEAAKVLFA